jgi:uncharacterized secreted protein with C-terminal beta-propeller domain
MSRRSSLLVMLAIAATGLAGCTSSSAPDPAPATRAAGPMALVAFDSCAQLLHDLRAAAQRNVGEFGFPGTYAVDDVAMSAARTAVPAAAAASAYSGTNNHELDADEPDMVKTDGRRIVTLSQGKLTVVDAATRRVTGRLNVGGDGQLLISGDHALVLLAGAMTTFRWLPGHPINVTSQILLVDLAGTPRIISRYEGRGDVLDARQTGTVARVVLHTTPRIVFPQPRAGASSRALTDANRDAIGDAGIDAWLPSWTITTGRTTSTGTVPCGSVSRPAAYSGTGILTVLTFDLGRSALSSGDPVSITADGNTVYGTGTSLYVASDQRWRGDKSEATDIYRFSTEGSAPPRFVASGQVPGYPVNQYALSEWDGRLRIATTGRNDSAVRILETRGDRMTQVGVVGGLGRGEQIYSVQYDGPRGYVVTFRQVDPLYAVDLSDPGNPRLTGSLKISGYSSHLQPIGGNRLIGIGQEATSAGRVTGTQVSLFDVSDPAAPRQLARFTLPGGWSEAEYEPHALLWWPATRTLAVPVNGSSLVLNVGDADLTRAGAIPVGVNDQVRRNLVIGSELWTVTETGLQAAELSTLDRVASIRF